MDEALDKHESSYGQRKPTIALLGVAFAVSLGLRIAVFSDFIPTGIDPLMHLIQTREIIVSASIPARHFLYFPGTPWVYPPLFHLLLSIPILLGAPPLQSAFSLALFFDVAIIFPIFLVGRRLAGSMVGCLGAILYSVNGCYMLTWGGYPNLMADFLIAFAIFFLMRSDWKDQFGLTVTIVLIGLTHHLSLAVIVVILCTNLVVLACKKQTRAVLRQLLVMILGFGFLSFWYLPRLQLYLSLLTTGEGRGLLSFGVGYIVTFGLGGVLVLATIPLILRSRRIRDASPVLSWFIAPILLTLPFVFTPNVVERFLYYAIPPALVASAFALIHWLSGSDVQLNMIKMKRNYFELSLRIVLSKQTRILLLLLLLVFAGGESLWFNTRAHAFFQYYDPSISRVALWYEQNSVQGTTIGPRIPVMYIAAIDGSPVVPIDDPVWFALRSERELISSGNVILNSPPSNQTFREYVCRMNATYLVFQGDIPFWVPNSVQKIEYVSGNYTLVSIREEC